MDGFELFFLRNIEERPRHRHLGQYALIFNVSRPFQAVLNNRHVSVERDSLIILDEADSMHIISSPEAEHARYELYIPRSYADDISTSSTDLLECFRYKDFCDINVLRLHDSDAARLRRLFRMLRDLSVSDDSYGSSFTKRLTVSYILLLANMSFRKEFGLSSEDLPLPRNSRFYQIVTYIRENYWEDITIDGLSIRFNISRNDLSSLFRQFTGRTPIQYLIEYRISKATEFLKEAVPVEGVCNKVGFNNYPHFSRTFKKRLGMSPKQYQRMIRGSR